MPRRRRGGRAISDPEIWDASAIDCSSTTVTNATVFTNNTHTPRRVSFRSCAFSIFGPTANSTKLFVLRRVPQGYSNPSLVTGGSTGSNTNLVDQPNVLAIGTAVVSPGLAPSSDPVFWPKMLFRKRSCLLLEGDTIILQAVSSASDSTASAAFVALMEVYNLV